MPGAPTNVCFRGKSAQYMQFYRTRSFSNSERVLPRRRFRSNEPQGQPITAVSSFVVYLAGKSAHQMDAEIADLGLLERRCQESRRKPGRVEFPACILDTSDHR